MASARQRGKRWTGLYRDASGKQKSAGTYDSEEEALARATVSELDANPPKTIEVYPGQKRGKPTIAGYGPVAIAEAKLEATSRETYTYLLTHVVRGLGSVALDDLTPADVRAFARSLESGQISSSTAAHVFAVLRLIVRTALQDDLMKRDVTAGISIQRKDSSEKVIATPAQARAIGEAIDPHYALLVATMFDTGMRYGELMALKASDIRDRVINGVHRGMMIRVSRSIAEVKGRPVERNHGKTAHATREIPISALLASKLAAQGLRRKDGYVFRNTEGRYIRRSNFGRIWGRACDAAGVSGLTPHGARHSTASWLANDPTVTLVSVQVMLGHSSLQQTSAYVHHIDGDGDDPRLAALQRIAA
jgi:integrase